MMEINHTQKNQPFSRISGIARMFIPLAIGILLGAFLYAKLGDKIFSSHHSDETASELPEAVESESLSDVVQISPESQQDVGITVEPADRRSLQLTLTATGTVSEDPGRVAHIRPLARGLVAKTYARLGDRVSAGDPLIEYDNIDLGLAIGEFLSARAELNRSLTDLEVRGKILERSQEMLRVGAVARTVHDLREAEVKDAEAKVDGTRATVAKIAEQIRRFGWTDQDLAKLTTKQATSSHAVSHSILRAPFSGVVTSHHAVGSEVVGPETELYTITDMSSLWVLADVYEKDLAQIRAGSNVRVRVPSYPGDTFAGTIAYIADAIDPKSRTAKVRCLVRNDSGLLKLGMFATIEIPVEQTSPVLVVPSSSIQQIEGLPVVFVRSSEDEFQRREVQTGIERQGYTEIRSGLKQGEPVVNQGSFILKSSFLQHLFGEDE